MLDRFIIPLLEKALQPLGPALARAGLKPEILLGAGFLLTLGAAVLAGTGQFLAGLVLFGAGRFLDGLAEASARALGISPFGKYLDIYLPFLGFAAIPIGFAFHAPADGLISALLVFSMLVFGASTLAYAGVARGLQKKSDNSGRPLLDFGAGLIGTSETVLVLSLMFLVPDFYAALALLFSAALLAVGICRALKARIVFAK